MPNPPTHLYAKVARGYLVLVAACVIFTLWLPLVLVYRALTVLSEAIMKIMVSMEEAAEKDIAAVKAWKAWNNLPQDKMYLSIYYGPANIGKSREYVAEKLHKMRAWSKEAGSPLAHWTDAMWDAVEVQVWIEFDIAQRSRR